ncbi:MAG: hypothetical protein GC193_04770 [Cryomorphaceae bacterium]|nr:hypothetical protein [Cryomorphaceae bacterium]
MRFIIALLTLFVVACSSPTPPVETIEVRPIKIGQMAGEVTGTYLDGKLVNVNATFQKGQATEEEAYVLEEGKAVSALCLSYDLNADSTITARKYALTIENQKVTSMQVGESPSFTLQQSSENLEAVEKKYIGRLQAYLIALDLKPEPKTK